MAKTPPKRSEALLVSRELDTVLTGEPVTHKHLYRLPERAFLGVGVIQDDGRYRVHLVTDMAFPVVLHWGVAQRHRREWYPPDPSVRPAGTTMFKQQAAQTPFQRSEKIQRVQLSFPKQDAPLGVVFVLTTKAGDRWIHHHGGNFFVRLAGAPEYTSVLSDPELKAVADRIIERETGNHSWTLMHRFDLCYELLDRVGTDENGLALIFVWLRFSAIRQLDWQRNYNTKPRELSHAMDRLTRKFASLYTMNPHADTFIRLSMTTMGRGGEGQRVRDEVLNIMHRHHIKEVSGHFMEEWHQKLHNNTTPDDVAICNAYLAFLKSDGDLDQFYNALKADGVTKERLKSYERPIVSDPDFIPDLKDALIHDFEQFLKILKGVHSGTDLDTAANAAAGALDSKTQAALDTVLSARGMPDPPVADLAAKITDTRRRVISLIKTGADRVRDLLFLDLALEDFLRLSIEARLHTALADEDLIVLVGLVLENLMMTAKDDDLACCWRHWNRIKTLCDRGRLWALEARAAVERLYRNLGAMIDRHFKILQPKAELLGKAFGAAQWTVSAFTEEVVRARLPFVLSALISKLDPILRAKAHLGDWQIVSAGRATGTLKVAETLAGASERDLSEPTVILARRVSGQEEIPENVTAIITSDTTDVVSHVAIRARNARVVLATCYDPDAFARLESFEGRRVGVQTTAAGQVTVEEVEQTGGAVLDSPDNRPFVLPRPEFTRYAIGLSGFEQGNVGAKALNLKRLYGRLPEWIHLPASVALPFGVFERVLNDPANGACANQYLKLTGKLSDTPAPDRTKVLEALKQTVLALDAPADLVQALRQTMTEEGFSWPDAWTRVWTCIKTVWASKWNERAFLSRRVRGIPHEDVVMAVLVQSVIKAEYSFVIHTANPISGNRNEIYAEIAVGLGETLVGNTPGTPFGFTVDRTSGEKTALSFPSKPEGLFGHGLIFRSDSNAEDLANYAGAGLYDSVMLSPPRARCLDYTEVSLVTDPGFRQDLMETVAAVALAVESVFDSPQDIEGAYVEGKSYVVQTRPQVGLPSC